LGIFLLSLCRQKPLLPYLTTKMKRLAIYGVLTGLAIAGWTYLEYLFGFHTNKVGRYTGFLAFLLAILGLVLGIRAYRNKEKNGYIGFWEAVGAGAVITLVAGLIQAGFTYLYYVQINPGIVDFLVEMKRKTLSQRLVADSQIAAQLRQLRQYYQPLPLAFRSFGGFTAGGLIFTLLIASVLKKYPRQDERRA
jgi:hypothetical protein